MIAYRQGNDLDLQQVIDLYAATSLGPRRPLDQPERMGQMLAGANLVITAWDGPMLVGIARALTDSAYATYLADLAVRESHQRMGIGLELIRRTQAAAPQASIILIAAPAAVDYYPRIGLHRHNSAWILEAGQAV